jgi:exopolysaccharide production protein ExoZ
LLFNLQILRGLAALGVAFYHTGFNLPGNWHTDFLGVAIFFAISGFIMCFITREDANGFLMKRCVRIVPMYWIATLTFFALRYGLGPLAPAYSAPDADLATKIVQSLFFLPAEKLPVLGVGWTLNFEMYFYLVFALALWLSRRIAPLISAAIVYAVFVLDQHGQGGFLAHYYSHDYIHYFLAGIVLFYIWTFGCPLLRGWPVASICAAVIVCFFGSQFMRPVWPDWILPYYWWFPPIVVGCALFMESSGAKVTWRPAQLLGEASYSLYLSHTIFYGIAGVGLRLVHLPAPENSMAVAVLEVMMATLVGIAAHLYVEKPLLRRIKLAFGGNQKASAQMV